MEHGDFDDRHEEFDNPRYEAGGDFSPPYSPDIGSEVPQPAEAEPLAEESSETEFGAEKVEEMLALVEGALTSDNASTYALLEMDYDPFEPFGVFRAAFFKLPNSEDAEAPPTRLVVSAVSERITPAELDAMSLEEAQEEAQNGRKLGLDSLHIARFEPATGECAIANYAVEPAGAGPRFYIETFVGTPTDEVLNGTTQTDLLNVRLVAASRNRKEDVVSSIGSDLLHPSLQPDPDAEIVFDGRRSERGRGFYAYHKIDHTVTDNPEREKAIELIRKSAGFFGDLLARAREFFPRDVPAAIARERDFPQEYGQEDE